MLPEKVNEKFLSLCIVILKKNSRIMGQGANYGL